MFEERIKRIFFTLNSLNDDLVFFVVLWKKTQQWRNWDNFPFAKNLLLWYENENLL